MADLETVTPTRPLLTPERVFNSSDQNDENIEADHTQPKTDFYSEKRDFLPIKRPAYYSGLSKGFGVATGILGPAGIACFGVGLGHYAAAAFGATVYVLSPLPWLGKSPPDYLGETAKAGNAFMIGAGALTGTALVTSILTIAFGVKSRGESR